ncbi:hypothetical protein SUGI_0150060 [Cryptomeria japonica]|nr:hypothetical protein SUGI_0150060 [Cryptomeria japonica]
MDDNPFSPALYPHGHYVASVSASSKRKTMEKEAAKAVRSPYFCIEGKGNDSKIDRKGKAKVVVSPYFNHDYPCNPGIEIEVAPKNTGKARVVPASANDNSQGKEKEQTKAKGKAKVVVVSPYFDHHKYVNGNYKVVVKEKKTEEALHHQVGNPSSSSSSPSPAGRAGEGRGRGRGRVRFNPFLEAYRRKRYNYWTPPKSVHKLLQERYCEDPWKVLVICMLLNKTSGVQARRVISDLFKLCPNARTATKVETEEIEKIICSLGLQKKRSITIQRFSQEYLSDEWTYVSQLHGIGKYAADAYAIFCTGFWKDVQPDDRKLVPYWEDLWESEMTGN